MYKNLGNSTREGMFLYGYLPYIADDGTEKKVTSPVGGYEIYIRDQVGVFHELAPDQLPADRTSNMNTGDHNSGWHFVKYPIYSEKTRVNAKPITMKFVWRKSITHWRNVNSKQTMWTGLQNC